MMATQTNLMEQDLQRTTTVMETKQLESMLKQMDWAKKIVTDLSSQSKRTLEQLKDNKESVPPNSKIVGQLFVDLWDAAYFG